MSAEGSIKLVISNVKNLQSERYSTLHIIGSLPWVLEAKLECKRNVQSLAVYIYCNTESESTLWSCEADVRLSMHNHNNCRPVSLKFSQEFNFDNYGWGHPSFTKWKDVLDPKRGYIKNNSVTVEAHIIVKKSNGLQLLPTFNFKKCSTCSDGILVIDRVRLHISKSYLALHSPFFSALFFGEFKERNMDKITLKDIDSAEFKELLHVIYPSHKPVSAESVEFLLKLGDQYEVEYVMKKCEKFLTKTNGIPLIKKLVLADKYRLTNLHDVCIQSLKTTQDITAIKTKEEYKNLSDLTKLALFEKLLTLK